MPRRSGFTFGRTLNVGAGIFVIVGALVLALWAARRFNLGGLLSTRGPAAGTAPGLVGTSAPIGGGQFGPTSPTAPPPVGPRVSIAPQAIANRAGQAPPPTYVTTSSGFSFSGAGSGQRSGAVSNISATNVLRGYLDALTGKLYANPVPGGVPIYS